MKAFILLVAASAGGALAHPTTLSQRDSHTCPDLLYGSPTCCSIDIQGIADRDCNAPKSANNVSDLTSSCSSDGKLAQCCTSNIIGLGVLCKDPVGA
ncbi:hypothetical protein N7455_007326 [Penicillium solitum]|uniref:uncharacterized protein n=1 Tax=Penicillium solitum TaxID=60172 RepID=UPI0017CEAAE2|nr:hypothetical protein HAV15_013167 [Penicillium sp. str. \